MHGLISLDRRRDTPCNCPLFINKDIGFAMVSMTRSSIGTDFDNEVFIDSQASINVTMSNALMR